MLSRIFSVVLILTVSSVSSAVLSDEKIESSSVSQPSENSNVDFLPEVRQKLSTIESQMSSVENRLAGFSVTENGVEANAEKLRSLLSGSKVVNEKINGLESSHSTMIYLSGLVITLATFVGIGGVTFSVWEAKSTKDKIEFTLKEIEKKRDSLFDEIENINRRQRIIIDQFERTTRLSQMIDDSNFDSEIFYSDLTQLVQHPSPSLVNLRDKIIEKHSDEFGDDIRELARRLTG